GVASPAIPAGRNHGAARRAEQDDLGGASRADSTPPGRSDSAGSMWREADRRRLREWRREGDRGRTATLPGRGGRLSASLGSGLARESVDGVPVLRTIRRPGPGWCGACPALSAVDRPAPTGRSHLRRAVGRRRHPLTPLQAEGMTVTIVDAVRPVT